METLTKLWQLAQQQSMPTHSLYVVATPIGNVADMGVRALAVLHAVDAIACEDTRHSTPLLRQYDVHKPLIALHEHNEREAAEGIIARLATGERIALICDAGTPAVSDPGARLVAQVRAAGWRVVPIAGPSAVTTAISAAGACGAEASGFVFLGFLANKSMARRAQLQAWRSSRQHLVLYESPHRVKDTLSDIADILPQRATTIARELSKLYETIDTVAGVHLQDWAAQHEARGEYVLVVHGLAEAVDDEADWLPTLKILRAELPLKQAVALTVSLHGASKNDVYARALALQNEEA